MRQEERCGGVKLVNRMAWDKYRNMVGVKLINGMAWDKYSNMVGLSWLMEWHGISTEIWWGYAG